MASRKGVAGGILLFVVYTINQQPHESDNLDERITTISCKRVLVAHGRTLGNECLFAAKVYNESVQ